MLATCYLKVLRIVQHKANIGDRMKIATTELIYYKDVSICEAASKNNPIAEAK